MALDQAGVLNGRRAAVQDIDFFLGTTAGTLNDFERRCLQFCEEPDPEQRGRIREKLLFEAVTDNLAYSWLGRNARGLGLNGRQALVINACASGGYALSLGADRIRQGKTRMALCGGADVLCLAYYTGFSSLRAMAPEFCQPFDRGRKGLVLGEAAAFILLESGESLKARGRNSSIKLAGAGWSCDGYHMSKPHPEGLGVGLSIQRALTDARLQPEQIGCFIAHGTGTPGNDSTEAQAVRKIFGAAAPPVTAPKSMLGHSMGAASAVEAVIAVLTLEHQLIPPTITHFNTDPACPVDCVAQEALPTRLAACMTNSSGFGGNNATLVFTREEA
jgi:3-oxoacyl-[acyl-carrier-protein] synthase II